MSKHIHLQFLKSNEISKCKVVVNEECLQGLCPMLISRCLCKAVKIKSFLGRWLEERMDEDRGCNVMSVVPGRDDASHGLRS